MSKSTTNSKTANAAKATKTPSKKTRPSGKRTRTAAAKPATTEAARRSAIAEIERRVTGREPQTMKNGRSAGAKKKAGPVTNAGGRPSAINAAVQVLANAQAPMSCKDMINEMAARGLWSSPAGKTPEATLYAAILREIAGKGDAARFRKAERGRFELATR